MASMAWMFLRRKEKRRLFLQGHLCSPLCPLWLPSPILPVGEDGTRFAEGEGVVSRSEKLGEEGEGGNRDGD